MEVFISWSGELSCKIATLLHQFLTDVIQTLEPFLSPVDMEKGTVWPCELFKHLEASPVGIVCLTRENKDKPWIIFEAGALAKSASNHTRACTVLIDLENADIQPPLSLLQSTNLSKKEEMLGLFKTLNKAEKLLLEEKKIERAFDQYWDGFFRDAQAIIASTSKAKVEPKSSRDMVFDEILLTVRNTASTLGLVFPEAAFHKPPVDLDKCDLYKIIPPPDIENPPLLPHRRILRVLSDGKEIGTLSTKPYSPPVWLESTDKATPRIAELIDRILPTGGIGAITPDNLRITWEDVPEPN